MAFAASQGKVFLGEAFKTNQRSKLCPSPVNLLLEASLASFSGLSLNFTNFKLIQRIYIFPFMFSQSPLEWAVLG